MGNTPKIIRHADIIQSLMSIAGVVYSYKVDIVEAQFQDNYVMFSYEAFVNGRLYDNRLRFTSHDDCLEMAIKNIPAQILKSKPGGARLESVLAGNRLRVLKDGQTDT